MDLLGVGLLCLCQCLGFVGLCVFIKVLVDRKQAEIESRIDAVIHAWVDQPAPDKPNKLAELIANIGAVVGQNAAQSIMASFNADKAHVARVANGLADEVQGAQNPILGLLGGGRRGKGAAIQRLMGLLGGGGLGSTLTGGNGSSESSGSIRSRIERNR